MLGPHHERVNGDRESLRLGGRPSIREDAFGWPILLVLFLARVGLLLASLFVFIA